MTGVVAQFIVCLKKAFCHKYIVHYDEKFTSKMARQSMIIGGASKKKRRCKGEVDKISATILLQSFLK